MAEDANSVPADHIARPPLRVLFVEDCQNDVDLCLRELQRSKIKIDADVVETQERFVESVRTKPYDVILSDYRMPMWSGPEAFACLNREGKEIPFILVTGTLGEEAAVECIKMGMSDYVLKDRLGRLRPAIDRALNERACRAEKLRLEEELRRSEERYALAAMGANDGLWDWDLRSGLVHFSKRWKFMLGYADGDIGSSPEEWFRRVHHEDVKAVRTWIAAHIKGLTPHFEHEHRMLHRDGKFRWVLSRGLAVRGSDGKAYRIAGSQADIMQRKTAEQQLLHNAFHDPLTGLPNRALFMDRLGFALYQTKRPGTRGFAVLFLDLDLFKTVNDSLGHACGDHLLVSAAQRLRTCLRPGDTVARFGGDEFAALLVNVSDLQDVTHVADRIQRELKLPVHLPGQDIYVTASMGLVLSGSGYSRPEELIRDADGAMYRAKTRGKARYEIFDREVNQGTSKLLEMESNLRCAIEENLLRVFYQPILSLRTWQITGIEALVRWPKPGGVFLSPEEFIPVAEQTGLIIPLGQWVLRTACRQAKIWSDAGFPPFRMTVNVSYRQFERPDIAQLLCQETEEAGLPYSMLGLEITERIIFAGGEIANRILQQLRAKGIWVSVDHFGTGASSLPYLNRLPIESLKIDRSFMHGLSTESEHATLVKAIVGLAHNLKMKVIAGGVETKEQLEFLRACRCDEIQGHLVSAAMSADEFSDCFGPGGWFRSRKLAHRSSGRAMHPARRLATQAKA
jgi:diguanylate cyclase (GGDEF)-like protein/PAS domain S-box-containing protein